MSDSKIYENDGRLTESNAQISNPAEPTPVKIKGIFQSASEISRSEKYELLLDRHRLYVNGKLCRNNVISASASADYFVYVTREGKIRIQSTEMEINEENNEITAVQVASHPEKPRIWYIDTDGGIFEATLERSETEAPVYTFNNIKDSLCYHLKRSDYDAVDYRIESSEATYFNPEVPKETVLAYLRNSGKLPEIFPDYDNYSTEKLCERITIDSIKTQTRHEKDEHISSYDQSGYEIDSYYVDFTASFCVVGSKKGYRFTSKKKLSDGVPEGFTSFYDYIYNEYL